MPNDVPLVPTSGVKRSFVSLVVLGTAMPSSTMMENALIGFYVVLFLKIKTGRRAK